MFKSLCSHRVRVVPLSNETANKPRGKCSRETLGRVARPFYSRGFLSHQAWPTKRKRENSYSITVLVWSRFVFWWPRHGRPHLRVSIQNCFLSWSHWSEGALWSWCNLQRVQGTLVIIVKYKLTDTLRTQKTSSFTKSPRVFKLTKAIT